MATFAKKIDLDNHVLNYRARLKSDFERKMRSKNFAKLYYLNKEYQKALRYLNEYMSVKNDCPGAYKLQGKIQEAMLERDNAVQSYMKSLELDPSQTDLFERIMELIPYTNLEPDRVKLWTERLQQATKDSEFLERAKICSPCSSPGNITIEILNNSIPDSVTSLANKSIGDLNNSVRSDDQQSTPKSARFISPKVLSPYSSTKVNLEKIEKELVVLTQAQEGIVNNVSSLQEELTKSNTEIIELIKGLKNNFETLKASVASDLKQNIAEIKETVIKHTEMMDKITRSQISLEDAVCELTESYGGEVQGDTSVAVGDENKQTNSLDYSAYQSIDNYQMSAQSYGQAIPSFNQSQVMKSGPMFNPDMAKTTVFSRLTPQQQVQPVPIPTLGGGSSTLATSATHGMFQPFVAQQPLPLSRGAYVPISPPVEQSLPANAKAISSVFQPPNSLSPLSTPGTANLTSPSYMPSFSSMSVASSVPSFSSASNFQRASTVAPVALPASTDAFKKNNSDATSKPLSETWKPKAGWDCAACYTRNNDNVKACVACETLKPGCSPPAKPAFSFNFGFNAPPTDETSIKEESPKFSLPISSKPATETPNKDTSLIADSTSRFSFSLSNASDSDTSLTSSNTSASFNKTSDFSSKLPLASTTAATKTSPSFPTFTSANNSSSSFMNTSPFSLPKNSTDSNKTQTTQAWQTPGLFGAPKSEPNKTSPGGAPMIFGNTNALSNSSFKFGEPAHFNFQFAGTGLSTDSANTSIAKKVSDSDLEIIYVKEPSSKEVIEKTKKLHLPLNFYDYENAQPCPGCRGCDDDLPEDKPQEIKPTQSTDFSQSSGSNLFAQAIEAHGTSKTDWQFNKPNWDILNPQPLFQKTEKEDEDSGTIEAGEDAGGSDNAVFKLPSITMPDIIEVKTGEEEEEALFVQRAKIFLFNDKTKEWKERGIGEFKILKHATNNTYRMLLRRDKVLKIACNQRITAGMKFDALPTSENALVWAGADFSEETEKLGKFCLRFKNKEIKGQFLEKIEEIKTNIASGSHDQDTDASATQVTKHTESSKTSEPSELSKPTDKPDEIRPFATTDTNTADSGSNLFAQAIEAHGTAKTDWQFGKPSWEDVIKPKPVFHKSEKENDEEGETAETGEDDGGSDNAVFKLPSITMPDIVEVKTGEEEEEALFVQRAKIFLFNDKTKEWKERGIGEFKVLKHKAQNSYRMLLRRDKVLKIACNQRITAGMKFDALPTSENALVWAGADFSEETEKLGKFCLRFKNKEIKGQFLEKIEEIKSNISSGSQTASPPKPSSGKDNSTLLSSYVVVDEDKEQPGS